MNKANVRTLATVLLNETIAKRKKGTRVGYNQRAVIGEGPDNGSGGCGTVACIGGTAAILGGLPKSQWGGNVLDRGQKWLGITDIQAARLFPACPTNTYEKVLTPRDAALVLFNLAETGKVDWSVAA